MTSQKMVKLPETNYNLETCLVMRRNDDRKLYDAFSCLQERRIEEIMGDIRLNRSLDLQDVRREQRRVAALLGHAAQYKPGSLYKSPRGGKTFHHCVCSKLHPGLQCPHPSHNFLKEGLANVREVRTKATKFKQTKDKRLATVDSAELRRNHLRGIQGRSLTPFSRSPSVLKGSLQYTDSVRTRDINDFDYKDLTTDLGEGNNLPSIYRKSTDIGHLVPENTPETSMILANRSRKLRNQGTNGTLKVLSKSLKHNKSPVVLRSTSNDLSHQQKRTIDTLRYTHSHIGDGKSMDYCMCDEEIPRIDELVEAASMDSATSGYHTDSPKSTDNTKRTSKPHTKQVGHQNTYSPGNRHQLQEQPGSKERGRWCLKCGKCRVPREERGSVDGKFSKFQSTGYRNSGLPGGGYSLSREHSAAFSVNSISSGSFARLHEEYGDTFDDEQDRMSRAAGMRDSIGHLSTLSDYGVGMKESGFTDDDDGGNQQHHEVKKESSWKKNPFASGKIDLYPDGYNEAYDKAIAAAQISKLPLEPWMLGSRISKPYEFSYFVSNPYPTECEGCNKPMKKPMKTERMPKRIKPMKHVFGTLDVNDFYPGGKRNPLYLRK